MSTRIYFVAAKADIVKAIHGKIFYDKVEADEMAYRINADYQGHYFKVYSALVEVEDGLQG